MTHLGSKSPRVRITCTLSKFYASVSSTFLMFLITLQSTLSQAFGSSDASTSVSLFCVPSFSPCFMVHPALGRFRVYLVLGFQYRRCTKFNELVVHVILLHLPSESPSLSGFRVIETKPTKLIAFSYLIDQLNCVQSPNHISFYVHCSKFCTLDVYVTLFTKHRSN